MTAATAQGWLRAAAFHLHDKRRILSELEASHAPRDMIERGFLLCVKCEALMEKAVAQYLQSIR